jgi:hypothetical protein
LATTRVQVQVEDCIRDHWLPERFGQEFHRKRLSLSSGGVFDFDAVSADRKIVVSISTSGATTASGKRAVGKLMKIRADMFFFLLLPEAERRIIVLTEPDMHELCESERTAGRVPDSIEFTPTDIPEELRSRLLAARS